MNIDSSSEILSFDVHDESTIRLLPLPEEYNNPPLMSQLTWLTKMDSYPTLVTTTKFFDEFNVWMLKDVNQGKWTKQFTFGVPGYIHLYLSLSSRVLGSLNNGEVIVIEDGDDKGILIIAVVITTLMITAFHIKAPEIKMIRITIPQVLLNNKTVLPSTINVVAELSVKNPNIATFKYGNSTTILYYHGIIVGEAHTPLGQAKARRTHNMTMSIDVITSRFRTDPNFFEDITSGILTMSSYTHLGGRVKIAKIIKKHIDVKLNCTITANIRSQKFVDQKCEKKVSF
ncbi:Late embryogenesis abundant (LEA) hydroxyproline-rich glycoprotein family [Thalictrum thalictroides]|uniref:Late embryogenesis abundant (LEA) hydroxyproline-rich glycoprotein family n=1 Tax=Thalictrum thalictroides TaxID=46969 RepID=A0A7J6WHF3_THATH|nr:Late embryogenesis abundant (LEA) hydroxyproline-rich glycoprotein family [Thalictrum thalictroides]